jgi:4-hydroxythreonine-4-phosphate dehydrogenase
VTHDGPAPIALSLGEPAGIGPEIIIAAWRALRAEGPAFMVVGDAACLEAAPRLARVASLAEGAAVFADALPVLDMPLGAPPPAPGAPERGTGRAVIGWIETAANLALTGEASALVTAPIAKSLLYDAGFTFPGHTEFLGELARGADAATAKPVMMLVAGDLRVALATIHEPLGAVARLISEETVFEAGRTVARALRRDFGIAEPRLAVAALNPHAGEDGRLGAEEAERIVPAVERLRAAGVDARGPFPADTLFHAEARRGYDAALAMYHDQALIPAKMLDFWGGVNLTLGLPLVRASPDHGVAFDIAGKGVARADSLIAALRLAAAIAHRRAGA